jgi:hypothetical protein
MKATKRVADELTDYHPTPSKLLWHVWSRCRTDKARTKSGGRCAARSYAWWAKTLRCSVRTVERTVAILKAQDLLCSQNKIFAGRKTPHLWLSVDAQRQMDAAPKSLNGGTDVLMHGGMVGGIHGGITTNSTLTANEQGTNNVEYAHAHEEQTDGSASEQISGGQEDMTPLETENTTSAENGEDEHEATAECEDTSTPPDPLASVGPVSAFEGDDGWLRYKGPHDKHLLHPSEQPKNGMAEDWLKPSKRPRLQARHELALHTWYDEHSIADFAKLLEQIKAMHEAEKARANAEAAAKKAAEDAAKRAKMREEQKKILAVKQAIAKLTLEDVKSMYEAGSKELPAHPREVLNTFDDDSWDSMSANKVKLEAKWLAACKQHLLKI